MMIRMAWVALAALILVTSDATAQTRLRMANWLPPSHPLVAEVMVPWSKAVEEATQGRVSIEIMQAPLGPPPAHFDFAVNGIADITYGVHNYTPGRFPTTELAELPFLSDSARNLSVAYWRIYDRYLKAANEQRGVQVLGVFVHGPGQLYTTKREIGSIEDLRGLKIRIGGGVAQEVAKAIGVVPIQAPVTQAYEILSQGVADGIQFPAEFDRLLQPPERRSPRRSVPWRALHGELLRCHEPGALERPGGCRQAGDRQRLGGASGAAGRRGLGPRGRTRSPADEGSGRGREASIR